jgi:hypothetical protein
MDPARVGVAAYDDRRRRVSSSGGHRRRTARWVILGVGLLVLLGGIVLADAYYQAFQIYRVEKAIQPNLTAARNALTRGQLPASDPFAAAVQVASRAKGKVVHANGAFRIAGAIPFFNRPIQAVRLGVDAASHEAQAAALMRDALVATLGSTALTSQPASGAGPLEQAPIFHNGVVDVSLIKSLAPRLEEVIKELQAGDRDIRAIPSIPFVQHLDTLKADALRQSARAIRLAQGAISGVKLLPSFLGADRPRVYYLALQNNADQRATGGAVLAYAFLRIDQGQLQLLAGGSIYDFDNILGFKAPVPSDLQWFLDRVHKAYPRLANINFSPNFPVVSQTWSTLLKVATGIQVDGVIAIDPVAIARMMGNRSVRVPAYPEPLTGQNLVAAVENRQYFLSKDQQGQFPGQLVRAAWKILQNPHPFLQTIKQYELTLQEKHMQIWSSTTDEEDLLHRLGWDGAIRPNQGDYFYFADNKINGGKVDFYTHIRVTDSVTVSASGSIRSQNRIELVNNTPPQLPLSVVGPRRYALNRALITLYTPVSSRLNSSYGPEFAPHVERGTHVFAGYASALPGFPGVVGFDYSIPGAIFMEGGQHIYQLTIQHQPLLYPIDLTVSVAFPVGSAPHPLGAGWTVQGNVATFHTMLTRDLVTRVAF